MADAWLADVAFPSFRDSARINPVPSTYEWFERPKIQRFCTRYDMNPGVLRFASSLENFSRGLGKLAEGIGASIAGSAVPGLRAGTDTLDASESLFTLRPKSRLMQYLVTNRRAGTAAVGVGVALGGALIAAGAVNYVQGGSTYVSTSASTSAGTALRASRRSSDRRLATSATRSSARCSAVGPRPRLTPRLPSRL